VKATEENGGLKRCPNPLGKTRRKVFTCGAVTTFDRLFAQL